MTSTEYQTDRCEGVLCSKNDQCKSKYCYLNMCSGRSNCHTSTVPVMKKCEGLFCSALGVECVTGICIQNSCSADKTCATHQTAIKEKCEGVMCMSSDECVLNNDKNRTCFGGFCSKNANCSTSTKSSTSRCKGVECEKDSHCLSGRCTSGLCLDASYDSKSGSKVALLIFIPLLLIVIIGGAIQYNRKKNRKLA